MSRVIMTFFSPFVLMVIQNLCFVIIVIMYTYLSALVFKRICWLNIRYGTATRFGMWFLFPMGDFTVVGVGFVLKCHWSREGITENLDNFYFSSIFRVAE